MKVICEQFRDGIRDEAPVIIVLPLDDELVEGTLDRKLLGAENHGWNVEWVSDIEFHAWKYYADGDGTIDKPNRKDRFFRIIE